MGRTIHRFQVTDSTNSRACELAGRGAAEGEAVVADAQDKGRGRMGRIWHSPSSANLYLSVILRPTIPPGQASLLTLLAAVATAESVAEFSGLRPAIKWPNDILLNGRKTAGLLNEMRSEAGRILFVIMGFGVNLNLDEESFPAEIRGLATSLKRETGQAVSRPAFLGDLLRRLEAWYELFLSQGPAPILNAWRDWAQTRGRPVHVISSGENWTGLAVDIAEDGGLIVRTEDGRQRKIVSGDVEDAGPSSSGFSEVP